MAHAETRVLHGPVMPGLTRPPSVLVVVVCRDGLEWLRRCLSSLARQTHPRIGVLAVDNASTDGSVAFLTSTLGAERVIPLERNHGFPGAVTEALRHDAAARADYVLLLHDDTQLAPEAVARLVEAAERLDGVGVVGPKVLDAASPTVLREIGLSVDRFGYPYSPLEPGEIDQGQYDRVREVFYVSSCAMLVSRAVLERVGAPDERLAAQLEDMDLCWRARLAGFRVLWTPQAIALHEGATHRGERSGVTVPVGSRYQRERAALASVLKNYRLLSLLSILPLFATQGAVRLFTFMLTGRFGEAYQVLAAWGWNVAHLPGTVARRVRAQSVRAVRDRDLRQLMAPSWIRVGRWTRGVAVAIRPSFDGEGEAAPATIGTRLRRLSAAHPVAVGWMLAALLCAVAYRHLSGASPLAGGSLPAFLPTASGFFGELVSGLRHTGLGGTAPGSPALAVLGGLSVATFGSPAVAQKALLFVLPAVGAVTAYRALRALAVDRTPAVLAAACYALSACLLWSLSEGRVPELVFLAGLPWMATRLASAFAASPPPAPGRFVVGTALGVAVMVSFFPGTFLAALVLIGAASVFGAGIGAGSIGSRGRGLALAAASIAGGALLALPVTIGIRASSGAGLVDAVGVPSFPQILRTSLGPAPGAWPLAALLPIAAAIGLVVLAPPFVRVAGRAVVAGVASAYLAWAAAAGWLPLPMSNAAAYVGVLTLSLCLVVGVGLQSVLRGLGRAAFGYRQLGSVVLVSVVGVLLLGQSFQAARGGWAIGGPDRVPAAYAVVAGASVPGDRVLWLGRRSGAAFPAPGGLPDGTVAAGPATVRYAVRTTSGVSALDIGRPAYGIGYDRLEETIHAFLGGESRHAGALLAPFGIRFVLARAGDLPFAATDRLGEQVDLSGVNAGGLMIYRDDVSIPVAAVIPDAAWASAAARGDLTRVAALTRPTFALLSAGDGSYEGRSPDATERRPLVLLSQQFASGWRLVPEGGAKPVSATPAFGWAVGFTAASEASSFSVRYAGQAGRTAEMVLLAALWVAALWVVRRPARSV